jgi:GDP-L-fucose synthase
VEDGREAVEVWGDGTATRDFLYVDDAVSGIVLASEQYDSSEPVNIGSGHEISIARVVDLVAAQTGFGGRIIWDTSKPNGQPRRRLDITRADARFGFRAQMPFEEGLQQTALWYMQTRAAVKARSR